MMGSTDYSTLLLYTVPLAVVFGVYFFSPRADPGGIGRAAP
jgi:hypothetical protein